MIYHGAVHPALTLVIYALAVARGTVLVTEDRITEAPRAWALAKLEDRDWRPFRKLARQHWKMGAEEMAGSVSKSLYLRFARKYVPEVQASG